MEDRGGSFSYIKDKISFHGCWNRWSRNYFSNYNKEKVSRNTTQGKKEEPNAKRKAAAWVGKRVQASGLPLGWLVGRKVSDDGRGSRKYYIQPGTDIVFKSKKEAERFLKQDLGGASKEYTKKRARCLGGWSN